VTDIPVSSVIAVLLTAIHWIRFPETTLPQVSLMLLTLILVGFVAEVLVILAFRAKKG